MTKQFNFKVPWLAGAIKPAAALVFSVLSFSAAAETVNIGNCLVDVNFNAEPSIADRETMVSTDWSTLSWSVQPSATTPNTCNGEFLVSLENHPVEFQGSTKPEVTRARTFSLKVSRPESGAKPAVRNVTVSVLNDPGMIEISDGPDLTDKDLEEFNKQWMQPWSRNGIKNELHGWLSGRIFWWGSEWMEAMVRMYELTKAKNFEFSIQKQYVKHLKELNDIALSLRDDKHPEPNGVLPADEFRGNEVLPGWGGRSIAGANKYGVSEVTFAFIHSFAAFGRIVAENPALQAEYGAQAVDFINQAIKAAKIFMPQLYTETVNGRKQTTIKTVDARPVYTKAECDSTHAEAVEKVNADPDLSDDDKDKAKKSLNGLHKDCLNGLKVDGYVMAHNWNQWFMMGLIELWRAMDSTYYRSSAQADPNAAVFRHELPLVISRMNRFFVNHMRVEYDNYTGKNVMVWNYNDDLPDYITTRIEDTNHASLDLRGVEVLRKNFAALNQVATALGEPIELPVNHLHLIKNTFMHRIALTSNGNLAENLERHWQYDWFMPFNYVLNYYPGPSENYGCPGWVDFAEFDPNVYHVCKNVTLKTVNFEQPYLTIGAHSALLMNKRWLPALPPPPNPNPTPPQQCPSTQKCCETADDGSCSLCVPAKAMCP